MRQVERKILTEEDARRRKGPVAVEKQRARLDGANTRIRYAVAPTPARQFDFHVNFDSRGFAGRAGLANSGESTVPIQLMDRVGNGPCHRNPCGIGVRAEVTTAAAFDPTSFFEGG